MSSVEVEYVATYEVSKEMLRLRKILSNIFKGLMKPTVIHYDNTIYIRISKDPKFHGKTKHINNDYH